MRAAAIIVCSGRRPALRRSRVGSDPRCATAEPFGEVLRQTVGYLTLGPRPSGRVRERAVSNRNRDAIEAMIFKPAAGGGLLFQAPKPWLFGRPRNHLVSEAQKDEILNVMAPSAPPARRYAVVAALIFGPVLWALAITALVWAISDHDEPTFGEGVVMMALIVVPILGALFVAIAWSAQVKLAQLAPL